MLSGRKDNDLRVQSGKLIRFIIFRKERYENENSVYKYVWVSCMPFVRLLCEDLYLFD